LGGVLTKSFWGGGGFGGGGGVGGSIALRVLCLVGSPPVAAGDEKGEEGSLLFLRVDPSP